MPLYHDLGHFPPMFVYYENVKESIVYINTPSTVFFFFKKLRKKNNKLMRKGGEIK
jgi:hypothetical protein